MYYRLLEETETYSENEQQDNSTEKSNQKINFRRDKTKKLYIFD